jgi:hypothetical protein
MLLLMREAISMQSQRLCRRMLLPMLRQRPYMLLEMHRRGARSVEIHRRGARSVEIRMSSI